MKAAIGNRAIGSILRAVAGPRCSIRLDPSSCTATTTARVKSIGRSRAIHSFSSSAGFQRTCPLLHLQAVESLLRSPTLMHAKTASSSSASTRISQVARHFASSSTSSSLIDPPNQTPNMSRYSVRKIGAPNTLEHRVYIEKDGQPVSAFHDVPLYADKEQTILNMIVEIPRWTQGKLEVRQTRRKL